MNILKLDLKQQPFILDVRTLSEWNESHLEGSTHIELQELPRRLNELPKDQAIYTLCRSGGRSEKAAFFLLSQGFNAINLEGGMLLLNEGKTP